MCCFSVASPGWFWQRLFGPEVQVSGTNIFVRMSRPGMQGLAYGMNLKTPREIAMVLPLPVLPGSGEDAVRFIDLSLHPRMFGELDSLFESVPRGPKSASPLRFNRWPKLVVHELGSFV